jgi:hypothetical protein
MNVAQRVSEAEYEQIVLAEPIQKWELVEGRLWEKPGRSWDHSEITAALNQHLRNQLDPRHLLATTAAGRRGLVTFDRRLRRRHENPRVSAARRSGNLAHSSLRTDVDRVASPFGRDVPGNSTSRGQGDAGGAAGRGD